jgi:hypothetical protein
MAWIVYKHPHLEDLQSLVQMCAGSFHKESWFSQDPNRNIALERLGIGRTPHFTAYKCHKTVIDENVMHRVTPEWKRVKRVEFRCHSCFNAHHTLMRL